MLTVIMPTHNGADTLGRTLNTFARLAAPPGGWQLLLVDNASTDGTRAIVNRYADQLPLRYIEEPELGKSRALNAGIGEALGDFVVFTDDDVLVEPDWLCEWRRVADTYPEFDLFGGAIVPGFEEPPPPWLDSTTWAIVLYTATAPGRPEGAMAADAMDVFGPNMAVRTTLLARGLRFDERLMVGSAALLGDETEFVDRAVRAGARVGFAPTTRVRHIVLPVQVTWRWMLRRFYRHGRTMFFFDRLAERPLPRSFCGVPIYLFRRIGERTFRLPLVLASCKGDRIMAHLRLIAYDLGAAHQAHIEAADKS